MLEVFVLRNDISEPVALSSREPRRHSHSHLHQQEHEATGPNMVPLDVESKGGLGGTSEEPFGELAALLVGFTAPQFESFRRIMISMDADIVKVRSGRGRLLYVISSDC